MLKILKHIGFVLLTLFLFVGIPLLVQRDNLIKLGTVDATAGGSIDLSEYESSGSFVILINETSFSDRLKTRLVSYFDGSDRDSSIFITKKDILTGDEKIKLTVINGDSAGITMGQYYQGAIANGAAITLDSETGILVVSKAEKGMLDLVVMSEAMAEAFSLKDEIDGVIVLHVTEDTSEETATGD